MNAAPVIRHAEVGDIPSPIVYDEFSEQYGDDRGAADQCPVCLARRTSVIDDEAEDVGEEFRALRCNPQDGGCGATWVEHWQLLGIYGVLSAKGKPATARDRQRERKRTEGAHDRRTKQS